MSARPKRRIQTAAVAAVRPHPDNEFVIQAPGIPTDGFETDFALTVFYDLLQAGVSWVDIRLRYPRLKIRRKSDLIAAVERNGYRAVWDETSRVDGYGYTRMKLIPLAQAIQESETP